MSLSLPSFSGATRRLILANVVVFFALALLGFAAPAVSRVLNTGLLLEPLALVHGEIWQPFTYSFVNFGILGTLFAMLSLWFTGIFLEERFGSRWLLEFYLVNCGGRRPAGHPAQLHTPLRPPPGDGHVRRVAAGHGASGRLFRPRGRPADPLQLHHQHEGEVPRRALRRHLSRAPGQGRRSLRRARRPVRRLLRVALPPRRSAAGSHLRRYRKRLPARATITTDGSGGAPRANSRSTCASRTAKCTSTRKAATSIRTPATPPPSATRIASCTTSAG